MTERSAHFYNCSSCKQLSSPRAHRGGHLYLKKRTAGEVQSFKLCDDEQLAAVLLEGQVAEPLEDLWHLLGVSGRETKTRRCISEPRRRERALFDSSWRLTWGNQIQPRRLLYWAAPLQSSPCLGLGLLLITPQSTAHLRDTHTQINK